MNRIDTDELTWKGAKLVFKALCQNVQSWCSNCLNCAHFKIKDKCLKNGS